MKRLLGILVIASASIVFSLQGGDVSAQDEIYVSALSQANAPHIVNGTVLSTESVVLDGEPHRVSEIEISSSLKGDLTGSILVEIAGGELGDGRTMYISHTPDLIPGEMVQLAVADTPGIAGIGLSVAVNPDLDVYSIVGGLEGAYGLLPDGVGRAEAVGDYSLTGVAWEDFDEPVGFWVNPAHSGVSETATINAVKRGFQMWEDDTGSVVDFDYKGTTSRSGFNLSDGKVTVSWVYPPASSTWIAQASWIADFQGNTVEFDVRVNRNRTWANGAAFGRLDIGTTIGHEVGHGIGFHHVDVWSELMYPSVPSGATKGLGPGDRSGVAFLYPRVARWCNGQLVTVDLNYGDSPTSGDDVIYGTPGDDVINARDGDDIICAGRGHDVVDGGDGDDFIAGGHQGDELYGGRGNDRILGESGNDKVYGEHGNDDISGNSGNDKLYGAQGDDILRGGSGNDRLWGDDDIDRLYGGDDDDRLYGGDDDDRLDGGNGDDRLTGDDGDDALHGEDGLDTLNGSNGDDELYGGDDADDLSGNGGEDVLDGGTGNDQLDGGSNDDRCDGDRGVDVAERCEIEVSAS